MAALKRLQAAFQKEPILVCSGLAIAVLTVYNIQQGMTFTDAAQSAFVLFGSLAARMLVYAKGNVEKHPEVPGVLLTKDSELSLDDLPGNDHGTDDPEYPGGR